MEMNTLHNMQLNRNKQDKNVVYDFLFSGQAIVFFESDFIMVILKNYSSWQ